MLMFVIFPDSEQYLCREELHNHFPSPAGPGDQFAGQSLDTRHQTRHNADTVTHYNSHPRVAEIDVKQQDNRSIFGNSSLGPVPRSAFLVLSTTRSSIF